MGFTFGTYTDCYGINRETQNTTGIRNDINLKEFADSRSIVSKKIYAKRGNIYEKDFASIWESERARKIRAGFNDAFIHKFCRKACRLDEMNKYLHELKYPGAHVNFI